MNVWLALEFLCMFSFAGFALIVILATHESDARRALFAMTVSGFLGLVCLLMFATR